MGPLAPSAMGPLNLPIGLLSGKSLGGEGRFKPSSSFLPSSAAIDGGAPELPMVSVTSA